MMSKWIFSLIELKYRFSTPAAPERQRTHENSASVPRPTHTAALAIPGDRTGVAPEVGERGFLKVGLPKMANNSYIFFWLSGRALDSGCQKSEFKSPSVCFFAFLLVFFCLLFFPYCTAAVLPVVLVNIVVHSFVCVLLFFSAVLRYCCTIMHPRGGLWMGWWVDTATAILLCTRALYY